MMRMLREAILTLWRHKWLVLPLYIVHLLYGLTVGSKIRTTIENTLGNSYLRTTLQDGYQSNVMADMIRHQGLDLGVLLTHVGYGLLGGLLLSVWIQSGAIAVIATGGKARQVLQLGSRHFAKYVGLSVLGLVLLVAIWLLLWAPYLAYSNVKDLGFLKVYHSEKPFFIGLMVLAVASFMAAVLVSGWTTAVKGNIASAQPAGLWSEGRRMLGRAVPLLVCSVVLLALTFISTYLFTYLVGLCPGSTWMGLAGKIFFGQCLIITYCKLRIMWYGSVLGN